MLWSKEPFVQTSFSLLILDLTRVYVLLVSLSDKRTPTWPSDSRICTTSRSTSDFGRRTLLGDRTMGCGSSKHVLETVDDSVHVMLTHEKKVAQKKGEKLSTGYKPRVPHPLLQPKSENSAGANKNNAAAGVTVTTEDDDDNIQNELNQQTEQTTSWCYSLCSKTSEIERKK